MGWVSLFRVLLKLGSILARIIQQKQLMDAGEAMAISKGLQDATSKMDEASKAIRDLRGSSDLRRRLRRKFAASDKD
jgi:hypothetical protein|tara:strand:- start:2471 stop:2701 length:231 start_codon:yes stop_codon:yes gene_type:complete